MSKWIFEMETLEKGKKVYKITANDKQTAIAKGHEKIKKSGLTTTPYWNCKLL